MWREYKGESGRISFKRSGEILFHKDGKDESIVIGRVYKHPSGRYECAIAGKSMKAIRRVDAVSRCLDKVNEKGNE